MCSGYKERFTRLRSDQSDLEKLREENVNLRGQLLASAVKETKPEQLSHEMAATKQVGLAKLNFTRAWLNAFRKHAVQNQGQMPSDFAQASSYLLAGFNRDMDPNQFKIVYRGSLQQMEELGDQVKNVIVL